MSAAAPRTLRSKRLRTALWLSTNGHCALCGRELGKGWHADHVEPWKLTKDTNVHNMQPLCATCNLRKGSTMSTNAQFELRSHQADALKICDQVIAGTWSSKQMVVDAGPGSGKTGLAVACAVKLVHAGVVQRVVHVVPRKNLRRQVTRTYAEGRFGTGVRLAMSDNRPPLHPSDKCGVVVGYEQLQANPDLYVEYLRAHPTLLIFDELQFLCENDNEGAWTTASRSVYEMAAFTILMTGTAFRGDGRPLPFINYSEPRADGKREPIADIRYTMRQATADVAIKGLDFVQLNGDVSWLDRGDNSQSVVLGDADESQVGDALQTYLRRPETWQALLLMGLKMWEDWREHVYPSRMIVVAADQPHARTLHKFLCAKGHDAKLSISDDGSEAETVLDEFRNQHKKAGTILVTVAKATVGFDCKDITHIVYLSAIRSVSWVVQCFMRAARIDDTCVLPGPYQRGWIFTPKDRRMMSVIEWLKTELSLGVGDRNQRNGSKNKSDGPDGFITPVSATPLDVTFSDHNAHVDAETSAAVRAVLSKHPKAIQLGAVELGKMVETIRGAHPEWATQARERSQPSADDLREARSRELDKLAVTVDARRRVDFGTTNLALSRLFGPKKSRTDQQMSDALAYVKSEITRLDAGDGNY